ncbi:MAG: hypothetical protein Q6J68_05480 [Thermostichales cyanobacterium SZTDM-1c_bins_54]
MEELKQTRYVQELMAEKLNEGRQEGELAIVLKLLSGKLGSLRFSPASKVSR